MATATSASSTSQEITCTAELPDGFDEWSSLDVARPQLDLWAREAGFRISLKRKDYRRTDKENPYVVEFRCRLHGKPVIKGSRRSSKKTECPWKLRLFRAMGSGVWSAKRNDSSFIHNHELTPRAATSANTEAAEQPPAEFSEDERKLARCLNTTGITPRQIMNIMRVDRLRTHRPTAFITEDAIRKLLKEAAKPRPAVRTNDAAPNNNVIINTVAHQEFCAETAAKLRRIQELVAPNAKAMEWVKESIHTMYERLLEDPDTTAGGQQPVIASTAANGTGNTAPRRDGAFNSLLASIQTVSNAEQKPIPEKKKAAKSTALAAGKRRARDPSIIPSGAPKKSKKAPAPVSAAVTAALASHHASGADTAASAAASASAKSASESPNNARKNPVVIAKC